MKNKSVQKNSLKLKFVPYLALRGGIFSITNEELDEYISRLYEMNPFIEEVVVDSVDEEYWKNIPAQEDDLYSFLEHQINMLELSDEEYEIAIFILENLNEDGYFKVPIEEVANKLSLPVRSIEKVLKIFHELDPEGIAARNLPECFIIQLERGGALSPKVKHIVSNHLEELANGSVKKIANEYGLSENFVCSLKDKVSRLNPTPGLAFEESREINHTPDIVIEQDGEEFNVRFNKKRDFTVNENYMNVIENIKDKLTKEQFESLLSRAMLIRKAVNERERLLTEVGEDIARVEKHFFLNKQNFPDKISLSEISARSKISESAISRLIQNKFILTPKGLFPLHHFVKHKSMEYNDEEVKLKIKKIVECEDKTHPLTDEKIEEILTKEGIKIKRRTIAKYRALLSIPRANKRFIG